MLMTILASDGGRFCAFILSHGRADNVKTVKSLQKAGYTGDWFIVIDNEDKQADDYIKNFGAERVVIFDKKATAARIDEGDNFGDRRAIIYARNEAFDIAERLGYKYFLQLDDDYQYFSYKTNARLEYKESLIRGGMDGVIRAVLKYYVNCQSVASVAFAQNGDFIGGAESGEGKAIRAKRKAMNSFFCSTERRFQFCGRINEDVNTYTRSGSAGLVFHTINTVSLLQGKTQQNTGGMTELYNDSGTYIKSFYSVMYLPSAVKVTTMHNESARIHHKIKWELCVPKIIREAHRK
jgi:hypothetical protein